MKLKSINFKGGNVFISNIHYPFRIIAIELKGGKKR